MQGEFTQADVAQEVVQGTPVTLPTTQIVRDIMDACDSHEPLPPGVRPKLSSKQLKKRQATIKAGLDAGVDINGLYEGERYTFLTCASSVGHKPIVAMLLDAGADPNQIDSMGFRPIHAAKVRGCNEDIVELLLQRGANPSLSSRTTGMSLADEEGCVIA